MDKNALFKLSYGLFVLTARQDGKDNGCIINTAVQVANDPARISISVIKQNKPCEMIRNTGVFNLSAIPTEADFDAIGRWIGDVPAYFIQRFVDSGQLLGEGFAPFTDEEMRHLLTVVREYVPAAQLRGC